MKYSITRIQYKIETRNSHGWLPMVNETWESSSGKTEQFKAFIQEFRKGLRAILKDKITRIEFHIGHFEISGFFETLHDKTVYYFNTGDLRFGMAKHYGFMLRTAKDFKDYTGGQNQKIEYDSEFNDNLLKVIETR